MLPGLRLSLLLLIAGCAEQALVVPDSDWRTVPPMQRDKIDHQHDADLAAARAELAAASASLAAFQRAQPVAPHARPQAPAAAPDPDDAYAGVARDHEKARTDALHRVEAAVAELQRSDLAWRQLRVDAANARIHVVVSQRELTRAQTIDHNLPGTDHYEVAPLRGQFSRAQQHWYAIANQAGAARDAFERASTSLASAKEAYAQLMRGGMIHLPELAGDDDHTAHLELTGWAVTRSDLLRRRRGLRHFLDDAAATPQLRKVAIRLSPAPRLAPSAAVPAEAPRTSPPPALPSADHRTGAALPVIDHPADRAGAPAPVTTAAAGKPPAATTPPAGTAAGNPSAAAPRTPAFEHPADRAGNPSPAVAASNTARAARPAQPAVPKQEHASPAAPPAIPVSSTSTAAAAAGSKAASPRGNAAASPADRAAAPATARIPPDGPAERPASQAAVAPRASRPAPPTGPAGVAKPVERPMPEADTRTR
ncbi:MAG TPA: hypothetical protein VGD37_35695 [Kofleriaceae bacterium]